MVIYALFCIHRQSLYSQIFACMECMHTCIQLLATEGNYTAMGGCNNYYARITINSPKVCSKNYKLTGPIIHHSRHVVRSPHLPVYEIAIPPLDGCKWNLGSIYSLKIWGMWHFASNLVAMAAASFADDNCMNFITLYFTKLPQNM